MRSGVSLPWGNAARGDALSSRNGWQVPAILDAGFKLNKPLFVGLYLGVGYGSSGESPRVAELCAQSGFDCSVFSYQLGVQAQYHFGASEVFNPWLGYGLGYELVEQSLETDAYSETQTSSGFTFLKASLGVDYRSSALVGLGPFVEVSAGRFSASETTVDDQAVYEGPVEESDWHGYLTFGIRMVLLP